MSGNKTGMIGTRSYSESGSTSPKAYRSVWAFRDTQPGEEHEGTNFYKKRQDYHGSA